MTFHGKPFIWTASQGALDGRTLACDWCGHMTDFLGSQMGAYDTTGWACRDCMRYGAPPDFPRPKDANQSSAA